jgi:hypothetical protein
MKINTKYILKEQGKWKENMMWIQNSIKLINRKDLSIVLKIFHVLFSMII